MAHQVPKYDQLWKEVITELFEDFLLFFAPDLYEEIDFSNPPEFLEQELKTIFPEADSNDRVADKLVRVQLNGGEKQLVYIHIEIQGGYKKIFPKRMFQSFYRILDYYDQKVYALALQTGERAKYNQDRFHYEFFGTELTYRYNSYEIAIQDESTLLQSDNPFALAILAGLYMIKSKKDVHLKSQYKRRLMRLLLQDKMINKEYIRNLLIFIDHILRLPEEEEIKVIDEIEPILEKEDRLMGLSLEDTSFAKFFRKEGFEEGLEKGREKEKVEIAVKLLIKGDSIEEVVTITGLPEQKVEELKEKI
ncbi:RpnC/YadD family protein [Bacillus niameyensis]|uniref:hypothetical protein n=1 Tax=Bacillus niameyensis TaxID=1522308 RepID=UPI000780B81C|nr:hypothetical protein [Bacillus niameyensis]